MKKRVTEVGLINLLIESDAIIRIRPSDTRYYVKGSKLEELEELISNRYRDASVYIGNNFQVRRVAGKELIDFHISHKH